MGMQKRDVLSPFTDVPRTHPVMAAHEFPVDSMPAYVLWNRPESPVLPHGFIRLPVSDRSRSGFRYGWHKGRHSPL
jgi:hypothetical protein